MEKSYIPPFVELVVVAIETGFATSDPMEDPDYNDENQDMPW